MTTRGQALADCSTPLASAYDAALLDLDGVLYLGPEPVPHATAAVVAAAEGGMRLAYVTNNASRAPQAVAEHLVELGIPATAQDVVTSGQAAARLVAEQVPSGSAVLVIGSDALAELVTAAGLRPVRTVEQAGPGGPAALVQGLSPDTTWRDLAEGAVAVRRGALWVTGNVDATLPTARGLLPGNGTMVQALRTATGREPVVAGKPEPALHHESVRRTGARRPLVVGDRLDTDILGAVRGGADSLLVLTGVVDVPGLLAAPRGSRPSYVAADLRALLQPQLPVALGADEARCGDASAVVEGPWLTVTGGRTVQALRAACALAWARRDADRPVTDVRGLDPDD
jgi:HAD superfamily hydrolase (TIGR01450 family)